MVETDVHFPTDVTLLWDAIRKVITLIARLCDTYDWTEWRQSKHYLKRIRKALRKAQRLRRSSSNDPKKKEQRDLLIKKVHQELLDLVGAALERARRTSGGLLASGTVMPIELTEIERFMAHAERQLDQVERRVIHDEKIPHGEKIFSVFEEYTEWLNKGKAGVMVELGLKVCVLEDQHGFILHHEVIQKKADNQMAVMMVEEGQGRFPALRVVSFDKGFWSPRNYADLSKLLDTAVLPRTGILSKEAQKIESSDEFVEARRKHPTVESGINALEVHGLDRCPDLGLVGFKRYIALAVTARNIQQLGAVIRKQEKKAEEHRRRREGRKAA